VPSFPLWRALWMRYTRHGLPALGRIVSREWGETGRFLAQSIPEFYARHPLEQLVQLWSDAGIASVRVRHMSLGGGVVIWGTRVGGKRADGGAATA
jgi:demethylmenaquinone methyltransferase/2-methoxy-6-polyprenyl-1,4-benzoquinol methylase